MLNKQTILDEIRSHRKEMDQLGVQQIGLFGSFARGEESPQSDLDFIVEFKHKTFDNYMSLRDLLENLFSRKVDLVLKESVKPRLRKKIFSELVDAA